MPEISVAVMAHRSRSEFVPPLLDNLDAPAVVVWDEHNDRWDTGRRSMLAFDVSASHHLVVQDDAIVCRDLVAGLARALDHVPATSPVCLYVGRVRPSPQKISAAARQADATRARWLVMKDINWGVGICVPTAVLEDLVRESDLATMTAYDGRLSAYFARRGVPVYYTWPSLVDHRDAPSLVPGRSGLGRHAYEFIGENASALDVDWSGPVVDLGESGSTAFRSRRTGKIVTVASTSRTAKRYRENKRHWIEESPTTEVGAHGR